MRADGSSFWLPPPLVGLRERLRSMARAIGETRDQVIAARAALADLTAKVEHLQLAHAETEARLAEVLRTVTADEPRRRDGLYTLRAGSSYALAFDDPEPLVSVVIPTYDRDDLLLERSLPSILAQTYQNFEVVVVGDAAPAEVGAAIESLGDPRISFHNLSYRGPYPVDPHAMWYVAGVPPFNEAVRRARGAWVAPLNDDDAFRPDHLEVLLEAARRDRLEVAYGKVAVHRPDGTSAEIGEFPPAHGAFTLQTALIHAGVAPMFPAELSDELFRLPWDWGIGLRMTRSGVRIGFLDAVVADGYPSGLWLERPGAPAP
jgi:hypothetical protein